MADIIRSPFGALPEGGQAEQFTLRAGALSCDILTYGGTIRALRVPDRQGRTVDVVLGFDTLEDYRRQTKYIGALVGRFANRIAGGRFTLDGREYALAVNSGPNHIHGGVHGFSSRLWTVERAEGQSLTLSLHSPHGDQGYPGDLTVQVTYTLTEEGLTLDYDARTDRATVCNLTNHAYFNLAGQGTGSVLDQVICLHAGRYTPANSASVPTGAVERVDGTPMDLCRPTVIGEMIGQDFPQLRMAGGYDHNWVIDGETGVLRPAAEGYCPKTGIAMAAWTTLPGVQFYTANYLEGCPPGKGGAVYGKRDAFCLETQFFPDSPNHPEFPSCVLRPGQAWHHTTSFRFSVR